MAQAEAPQDAPAAWNDRVFQAIPLSPIWVGCSLAVGLLLLFLAIVRATGDYAVFMQGEQHWWENRDARLSVVVAVFAAFSLTARRYAGLGARRNLEQVRTNFSWPPGRFEAARGDLLDPARTRRWAVSSLLVVPFIALLVDRDPLLYTRPEYWGAGQLWTWGIGGFVCWNSAVLIYTLSIYARSFSRLGRELPQIDLFDLGTLAPFARQALQSTLPGFVFLSLLATNLADRDFVLPLATLGILSLASGTFQLLLPLRGVRDRIQREKAQELDRLNAAIRGDTSALRDSPIAGRAASAGLADLLAYREFVRSVPEWPFDARARTRFALYVALPLGSWLGGALVERMLGAVLG